MHSVSMQVIAFISGWKMTLVVTAVVPLLGLAAYINTKFMSGFSSEVYMPHVARFDSTGLAQCSA